MMASADQEEACKNVDDSEPTSEEEVKTTGDSSNDFETSEKVKFS
jgi:hypothetical protein